MMWMLILLPVVSVPVPAGAEILLEILLKPPQIQERVEAGLPEGNHIDHGRSPGSVRNISSCGSVDGLVLRDATVQRDPVRLAFMNGPGHGGSVFSGISVFGSSAAAIKHRRAEEEDEEQERTEMDEPEKTRASRPAANMPEGVEQAARVQPNLEAR